jgi:hypothetical protein
VTRGQGNGEGAGFENSGFEISAGATRLKAVLRTGGNREIGDPTAPHPAERMGFGRAAAAECLRKCLATGKKSYLEYVVADMELEALGK